MVELKKNPSDLPLIFSSREQCFIVFQQYLIYVVRH